MIIQHVLTTWWHVHKTANNWLKVIQRQSLTFCVRFVQYPFCSRYTYRTVLRVWTNWWVKSALYLDRAPAKAISVLFYVWFVLHRFSDVPRICMAQCKCIELYFELIISTVNIGKSDFDWFLVMHASNKVLRTCAMRNINGKCQGLNHGDLELVKVSRSRRLSTRTPWWLISVHQSLIFALNNHHMLTFALTTFLVWNPLSVGQASSWKDLLISTHPDTVIDERCPRNSCCSDKVMPMKQCHCDLIKIFRLQRVSNWCRCLTVPVLLQFSYLANFYQISVTPQNRLSDANLPAPPYWYHWQDHISVQQTTVSF